MAKEKIRFVHVSKTGRKYLNESPNVLPLPNLIEIQTESFDWFIKDGLQELFGEIFPIVDYTGKIMSLDIKDYWLGEVKYSEKLAKEKKVSYEAPLKANVELTNLETGKKKTQEVFLGDIPVMTRRGTFIINGVERVVVSQLIRSPGVFFSSNISGSKELFGAKVIPGRGAWLEMETSPQDVIYAKIDRKRKIPITALLRAFGYTTNEEIINLFKDVNTNPDRDFIKNTFEKDPSANQSEAFVEVYKRIRPGDLATVENAQNYIEGVFFDIKKYDLSRVGRYKMNKRLDLDVENSQENHVLHPADLVEIIKEIINLNNGNGIADDIDNLGNRRVKTVGELLRNKFRMGLLRVERIIRDRMSTNDPVTVTASQLINVRPIVAAVREFFASSQLSQFMDQTNPLSELTHKRKLSSLGPGGLTRERAGFEVRDVHKTHYGRICPIETPEGPNIGLVSSLSTFSRINEYGFIETPYRKVVSKVKNDGRSAVGCTVSKDLKDKAGKVIVKTGAKVTSVVAKVLVTNGDDFLLVEPLATNEIIYLTADEEDRIIIAQAKTPVDKNGHFLKKTAIARRSGEADEVDVEEIDYIDVATEQPVGISAALIPFLEHDDARRALMGANMQRQAVALVKPESPIIGTGNEAKVAEDTGQVVLAKASGEIVSVTSDHLTIKYRNGSEEIIPLQKFEQSNTDTCINQKPVVSKGQKVKKGDLLVDGAAVESGELALGQNILAAFMCMEGGTFEDAIILSEKLVKDDRYTSIHLEESHIDVRDTKLGEEIITRDIPNVGEDALRDLDENGIVRIGAEVVAGDILIGKITPKGETELTAEERLLRAIFGEKARDVKDSSLRVQPGVHGKVVNVNIKSREKGDELPVGVIKQIFVTIAQMRKVAVGDKMAGRHGNKGVIAKVLPEEEMPYLEDGTPVDIILNPQGVISRMNFGQILETHLGWAAKALGFKIATPVFDGVTIEQIKQLLRNADLPEDGRVQLYDGRSGEPFAEKTVVGYKYMLKLLHLVEDKIHARSIGPYAMVTQQPLGGKAQFGGQRFGEMEVWALEAYGAAHTLQEILTVKSDDVVGRSKAYEAVIKGEEIKEPRIPESFNVLVKELQGLGLAVDLIQEEGEGKKEIEAEEIIEETYKENIEELKDAEMMVGSEGEKGLPALDVTEEETKDDFEVLEKLEKEQARGGK
jgi:DNA-directed RNA polymerase subunit beta